MTEIKLENCPFCNSKAEILYKNAPSNIIQCSQEHGRCPVEPVVGNYDTFEQCAKVWNTRPVEAQLRIENLKLREEYKHVVATLVSIQSLCFQFDSGVAVAIKEFLNEALKQSEAE